ncbi:hypothetical protein K501DRAFT_131455, partial [Backusella circina FSU 941]
WSSHMQTFGITHWHSAIDNQPLTYLGFPLYFNVSQRNNFITCLTDKIRIACHIHSQRNLSVRGRATVLNTLIFSKLWYVLRLTPLTLQQIDTIKSIGQKFINLRIFPPLAYSTLIKRRSRGGIGLLDIRTQQHLLQDRWLQPLLVNSIREQNITTRYHTCPLAIQYLAQFLITFF